MTDLREAAQMALAVLVELNLEGFVLADHADPMVDAIEALRAALAEPEPQLTHSPDCYRWHHACAVARIERAEKMEPVAWMHPDGRVIPASTMVKAGDEA